MFAGIEPSRRPVLRQDLNALKPGGPRTPEGKAISSHNSTLHGLTARQTVIRGEDPAEFDQLLQNLIADRKPVGELELQLTGEIAACTWRLARARQHEAQFLQHTPDLYGNGAAKLSLIIRYTGSIERELHRSIARLAAAQAERTKAQPIPAPAPEVGPDPKPEPVMVMAAGSSRPQFVSSNRPEFVSSSSPEPAPQPANTHNPPPVTHNSQPTTHN